MNKNGRDMTIDAAKGIGILCVYLGHLVVYGSPTFRAIFNFHMPLFFLLSGCFFRPGEVGGARKYFSRILVNIGLPIVFFTILAAIYSAFIPPAEIPHEDTYPYWLIYCVSTWHEGPVFVSNIWFLFCLGCTQAVAWFLWPRCGGSIARTVCLLILCILAAYAISTLDLQYKFLFPLMTSSVPMALVFFLLGYVLRDKIASLSQRRNPVRLFCAGTIALLIEIIFAVVLSPKSPNLAVPDFPSWWAFPIASVSGIIAVLLLASSCQSRLLTFLGRYSLYYFMLEMYASVCSTKILSYFDSSVTVNPLVVRIPWHHIAIKFVVSLLAVSAFVWLAKKILVPLQERVRQALR